MSCKGAAGGRVPSRRKMALGAPSLTSGGGSLASSGVDESLETLSLPWAPGRLTQCCPMIRGRRRVAMLRDWLDAELGADLSSWKPQP